MSNFKDLLEQEKNNDTNDASFAKVIQDIQPLVQDKIHFKKTPSKNSSVQTSTKPLEDRTPDNKPLLNKQAAFHFSDEYEPVIDTNSTLNYVKNGIPNYYSKLLRRGDIRPELILDLHGYNKEQAKFDLSELIEDCKKQSIPCACVIHGVGGGVLKRKLPNYLMQHPDVAAFHQAPLEWGGQGAIVLLIDLGEELELRILR